MSRQAQAHGDVHVRIDDLSARLRADPGDAQLLLERGVQHSLDENWGAALRDFKRSRKVDPANAVTTLRIGEALFELGRPDASLQTLDAYLEAHRSDPNAYELRARVHASKGVVARAVRDYGSAIRLASAPRPHWYAARAQLLIQAGQVGDALVGLEQGVSTLGPLVSLIEPAVDAAAADARFTAAQAWIERLPAALRDSPRWRIRNAELALRAGNARDARANLEHALRAIGRLPAARQEAPAIAALREEAQIRLDRIASQPATDRAPTSRIGPLALFLAAAAALWLRGQVPLRKPRNSQSF